jgi:Na+/phosphate symporter
MAEINDFTKPFRSVALKREAQELWPDRLGSEALTLQEALQGMMAAVAEMTRLLWRCFSNGSRLHGDDIRALAAQLRHQEDVLTEHLISAGLAPEVLLCAIRFPPGVERVGDSIEAILRYLAINDVAAARFSEKASAEVDRVFAVLLDMMNNLCDAFATPDEVILRYIVTQAAKLDRMLTDFRMAHWQRVVNGSCAPEACSAYLGILDSVKSCNEYLLKMSNLLLRIPSESRG